MLKIPSIKELLHKPSEIQWNITGTFPGKLKIKIGSYKILSPEITKKWGIAFFWRGMVLWGPGNQYWIQWFFMILWISEISSLYFLVQNSFKFKLGFFIILNIFWGIRSEKTFSLSDYHSARWYYPKKTRKTFHKLHIDFFLNASLWILHCYEHLWFKTFIKIHIERVKVEKIAFL